jgi:hypothetical protein
MREYTHNRGVPPAAWQGPSLKITQKPTREIYRKDVALTKAACSHLSTVIFDRVCDMETDRSDDYGINAT